MGIEGEPIVTNTKNNIACEIESRDDVTEKLNYLVLRRGSWRRCKFMVFPLIKHVTKVKYDWYTNKFLQKVQEFEDECKKRMATLGLHFWIFFFQYKILDDRNLKTTLA